MDRINTLSYRPHVHPLSYSRSQYNVQIHKQLQRLHTTTYWPINEGSTEEGSSGARISYGGVLYMTRRPAIASLDNPHRATNNAVVLGLGLTHINSEGGTEGDPH